LLIYKFVWEQKLLVRVGEEEVVECTAANIKMFALFEVKGVDDVVLTLQLEEELIKRNYDITKGQTVYIVDRMIDDFAIFDRKFKDVFPVIQVLVRKLRDNAKCTLQNNLQQTSTSDTQSDKAPVNDLDGSSENDSNVNSEVSSVEQGKRTVEQHSAIVEETSAYHELFHNLAAKVNSINRKMKETNAELTTELARYKNQEKCFEISQEKYDKLERCYQKSVYQEQCLGKRTVEQHSAIDKQITTLNEEISNLNKQLSKEKSTVSSLQKEKKRLKCDFKIRKDELLDKQIQLEKKIKELDNILVKTG
nr:hypothetical protein [Tanacetum cinerariifolium]